MRIAIVSDHHFGDPMCSLATVTGKGRFVLGPAYEKFKAAVGDALDYLVLVGDVFDFSVASYSDAYMAAKPFFEQIASDGTLKFVDGKPATPIIYVPGNHDYEMWSQVEYEVNVIRRMHRGVAPRSFRWSVPGVFDLRTSTNRNTFELPLVGRRGGPLEYGGLFLDKLTVKEGASTEGFPFYVAYPNVYLLTDNFSAVVTHGQYLESYWSFLAEVAPLIAGTDLGASDPMNIRDLVALNSPLSQLACSGVGQAGPLTKLVRNIQRSVKDGCFESIERYADKFDDEVLDKMMDYGWADPREWLTDLCINTVKTRLLSALKETKDTRENPDFLSEPAGGIRFQRFFRACSSELAALAAHFGYDEVSSVPTPTRMLYGHTHAPTPWGDETKYMKVDGKKVYLSNFGGWLYSKRSDTGGTLEGAEVVLIESGAIRSVTVS